MTGAVAAFKSNTQTALRFLLLTHTHTQRAADISILIKPDESVSDFRLNKISSCRLLPFMTRTLISCLTHQTRDEALSNAMAFRLSISFIFYHVSSSGSRVRLDDFRREAWFNCGDTPTNNLESSEKPHSHVCGTQEEARVAEENLDLNDTLAARLIDILSTNHLSAPQKIPNRTLQTHSAHLYDDR